MKRSTITKILLRQESVALKPYKDKMGHLTIGVGRNLDQRGIDESEALLMLDNDITSIWHALTAKFTFFGSLDDARQHALISAAFNLGVDGLGRFTKMVAAIESQNYAAAADEILDSDWAKQAPSRAKECAEMMRNGSYV